MYHLFFMAAFSAAAIGPPADTSELSRDTLSIRFQANASKPTEESMRDLYNHSREIYRAKRIKVWVLPEYRRASQDEIREKRLRELWKIFTQEGVAENVLEEETLDEKKASGLLHLDRELFCMVTIESIPYIKNSYAHSGSQVLRFDTTVYLSSGIPIKIDYHTYMLLERLPEIEHISGNGLQQHASKGEFELLGDYSVKSDNLKNYTFMIPIPAGKSERQMLVYRSDSTGKTWKAIIHKGKIDMGKLKALCIPIEANGIYRIGYMPRVQEQSFVLCMPKMMGLSFAEITRDDGMIIPGKIVLGRTALAFQIADEIERYSLRLKAVRADGQVVERTGIPLKECLTNRVSDSKLASQASIREFQGFIAPDCKYILQPDIFQDNIVNR
ncbi:MAG: hypothetical protein ACK5B6_02745 [Bacteroidia bacterium]